MLHLTQVAKEEKKSHKLCSGSWSGPEVEWLPQCHKMLCLNLAEDNIFREIYFSVI